MNFLYKKLMQKCKKKYRQYNQQLNSNSSL